MGYYSRVKRRWDLKSKKQIFLAFIIRYKRFVTFSSAWAQVTKRVSLTRSVAATPYRFPNLNALER
jgi:hypothetical protein